MRKVIIESGHGGMLNGKYQCIAVGKQYHFTPNGPSIYEGVVNREIAKKLIKRLDLAGIPYIDYNSNDPTDIPLQRRTTTINNLFRQDPSVWLLSIHSNAFGDGIKGPSSSPRGCETFVGINAGKISQYIQVVAERHYRADGHRWRGSKSANFAVLRDTRCPALLVENYFFTNIHDANYLLSEKGQNEIADTLFKIVKEVA
jgi:N-acetylmuramoyl-L-alanine amidase